jgi:hypothetical protein
MGCGASGPEPLTPEKIAQALMAALNQAAQVAVSIVSAPGGFSKSATLRITIPGDIGSVMEKAKALPGIGGKVDEFEETMNQAAEAAAGAALEILQTAVNGMNFENAKAILDGPVNAATDYFIKITRSALFGKFQPIVDEKMGALGVVSIYDAIMGAYSKIPFCDAPEFDLSTYVTNNTLKGLFTAFEQEEAKIRGNPAGEASDLIKDVFGQAGKKEETK